MPGGYELWVVKEGRAPAIYRRSGHVPAGHVPLPISPLHYLYYYSLNNIKKEVASRSFYY
jgi:hypothetical protein